MFIQSFVNCMVKNLNMSQTILCMQYRDNIYSEFCRNSDMFASDSLDNFEKYFFVNYSIWRKIHPYCQNIYFHSYAFKYCKQHLQRICSHFFAWPSNNYRYQESIFQDILKICDECFRIHDLYQYTYLYSCIIFISIYYISLSLFVKAHRQTL